MKRLKSSEMRLAVNGLGVLTNQNLTPILYETAMKINPNLDEYFEDTPETPKPDKKKPE